ncbi:MAG TPA: hypothetical protein VHY35_16145 [Stellaceae bacterium]|nr:hypothetical protein [Stellaceae bacterium]
MTDATLPHAGKETVELYFGLGRSSIRSIWLRPAMTALLPFCFNNRWSFAHWSPYCSGERILDISDGSFSGGSAWGNKRQSAIVNRKAAALARSSAIDAGDRPPPAL